MGGDVVVPHLVRFGVHHERSHRLLDAVRVIPQIGRILVPFSADTSLQVNRVFRDRTIIQFESNPAGLVQLPSTPNELIDKELIKEQVVPIDQRLRLFGVKLTQ